MSKLLATAAATLAAVLLCWASVGLAQDDALDNLLKKLDDAGWKRPVRFLMEGKQINETTTNEMLWGFLHDMIHHRGQLSTYIRPMGGKVPSIYGPSGDAAQARAN